jgi:VWFA-related protein
MKRRLAALLTCALIAFGQRSKAPEPPPKPTIRFVDFVALDAAGRPVSDLSLDDIEAAQSGEARKITRFAWFDTRRHTARGSESLPLELVPDEIQRNLIAIVDDLGLSAAGVAAVQESLRTFLKEQMNSGDRMAVLRTSSGSGATGPLTDDRRILTDAIDHIQFMGGNISERAASAATWLTLRYALQGLRQPPGRKVVVVFSPALRTPVRDPAADTLFSEANAVMATVYAVDPGGAPAPPMEKLIRETGGAVSAELAGVLQTEEGFYAIGFEEPPSNFVVRAWDEPVMVKVRRAGVTVRARSRYLTVAAREDFPAPAERALQIRRALASPYEASEIHTRLTAGFTTFEAQRATVDASVVIDAHDLSIIRDAKGIHRGSVRMTVDAVSEFGNNVQVDRSYEIGLGPAEYVQAVTNGLIFRVTVSLPVAGMWQIRAVVADGISDRLGSSVQCVEVPERDAFSISDLKLRGSDASGGKDVSIEPGDSDAVRNFRKGQTIQFLYSVFNSLAGENKQSHIEVTTRMYMRGHAVFAGAPSPLSYPREPGTRRLVSERLTLAAAVMPGEYILEVTVADKLAPPDAPRVVTRLIDFRIRE